MTAIKKHSFLLRPYKFIGDKKQLKPLLNDKSRVMFGIQPVSGKTLKRLTKTAS